MGGAAGGRAGAGAAARAALVARGTSLLQGSLRRLLAVFPTATLSYWSQHRFAMFGTLLGTCCSVGAHQCRHSCMHARDANRDCFERLHARVEQQQTGPRLNASNGMRTGGVPGGGLQRRAVRLLLARARGAALGRRGGAEPVAADRQHLGRARASRLPGCAALQTAFFPTSRPLQPSYHSSRRSPYMPFSAMLLRMCMLRLRTSSSRMGSQGLICAGRLTRACTS